MMEVEVIYGDTVVSLPFKREPSARQIIDRARRELSHNGIRPQGLMVLEPLGNVTELKFQLIPA